MPLPSSGIIVVEKPSSASITSINSSTTANNTVNSSIYPPQDQTNQQSQVQYYEYYDVNENQSSQRQQQYHHQQQQQHSTIVVDGTLFRQQQQQLQLGRPSVAIGRKIHSSSSTSSSSSSSSTSSSLCLSSSSLLNKPNFQIQTLKTVPMPQNKQYSQQQQITQHTPHSTTATTTTTTLNPQLHLQQQPQHVQQINLAASTIHHQTQHHSQKQSTPATHMIHVSEEFLEQASHNHNTGNMMISSTGEVINQQQIFKIVSTDGTTGNMIIDATNQNASSTTTTSKVLLSNLTVLSKQQTNTQGQIIGNNHQQPQTAGQTINFVNAKNLYTTSAAGGNIAGCGKQQKFTVATANVGNYKASTIKQTSSANSQYIQQPNSLGQQKINMTAGNRSMQMLTTRVQNFTSSNTTSNVSNNNSVAIISNNAAPAQTMVLQQPQKFIGSNTSSKVTTATLGNAAGNVIKKSTTAGTLRMNNSHNTAVTTKLLNNLQTTQGVKTFITQTSCVQQQTQQNMNQFTVQHHTTKGGSKSKFVKQYNNAILNSAGSVAIATLPHQQQNSQNSVQIQQQHQQLQPQTTYIHHHKNVGASTKINKINSKYAQSANMAAQLPPGTQLHQKSINQAQQQQQQSQFQTTGSNSNIKFVNAQGTVIQPHQQPLTFQKINKHHQQQYHNLQNFDTVDGNHVLNKTNTNQPVVCVNSSISSGTTTLPSATATGSSLLTDDIMMVNGTQMTDELSARILQSMSQKSFGNQRYQQQQQHVFQTKSSTTPVSTSINSNNNCNSNNMLPPPRCTTPNANIQTNNSNILLSPREYTLYPTTSSSSTVGIGSGNQHHLSPIHYNTSAIPTATASSTITAGSFSLNNYITVSSTSNNMTTITSHTSGPSAANGVLCTNTTNVSRQAQSAPGSRSQSMERKLHESSISRKSTEYYKVKIKDYPPSGCAFVVPTTGTLYATNTSPSATSLIDFIIPLPSCTTLTTTNNITTSTENCATMTTIITNSSYNHNINQINNNSNHNSMRGSSHHNNLTTAAAGAAQTNANLSMTSGNMSASVSNLMGGVVSTSTPLSPLPMSRPPSLPPAALIMEPQAQVIHLQATKTLPGANNSSNDDDDDIIGEEIRPAPVETEDVRLRILHAVLLDHTYVNPMPLVLPTSFAVQLPPAAVSNAKALTSAASPSISTATGHGQQWSLGGIGAIAAATPGGNVQPNYALYGAQLSRLPQDNDSYSALSNSSRLAVGDIDPGEETETAPEAELEDDSVTRCICDLTHDDGYMICCDKCCAWQHVDCMGIDRQNIPDEYLCELCQPRIVDKARARSLQLQKRKEQQHILLTAQTQAAASTSAMAAACSASSNIMGGGTNLPNNNLSAQKRLAASAGAGLNLTGNMSAESAALQLLAAGGSNLKKSKMLKKVKDGVSGKRTKKAEKMAAAAGLTVIGKPARKETKKNTKRKKAGAHDGGGSNTVGMTAVEKHAANLRLWIENYELAVTNHYSPELRARLHAICKQPSLLQSILNTENTILKEFSNGSLKNRATTVPHAGGKILISNLDIVPNSPICELRGKYMLTTQYKTQNTSMNMNSPPPNNYNLASYKAHKTPGPFIFFYQLPGTEVAVSSQLVPQTTTTTMLNPDGTYTTTTTTLPAQQSPPTFLKGPEICVDTRTYGNEARFVRRSCRPNAEIQHLFEKGTIHLFIVALTDIRASTEITIRHEPHDLLAVENKKSSLAVIQPTSTSCACGLTKDCIFGPPIPQLPPVAKSNAGRKSLTYSSGGSSIPGNLAAKQRKTNQQNFNRNRSTSSSASGDSNMGVTATSKTVAISLNSPSNVSKIPVSSKIINNNNMMPLTSSCNSNLSNASSTSSTLTSIMHDSGVCTSSSSPSVSIPSPTQNMHSPIQQQQQLHQQIFQHQLLHNTQIKSAVQLLPQQQQQQLMQSLPTPLVLTSPNMPHQHNEQQSQQESLLQEPAKMIQQQQPLNVIAQSASAFNSSQNANFTSEQQKQPPAALCLPTPAATVHMPNTQTQQHLLHQQIMLQEEQPHTQPVQHQASVVTVSAGLLDTVSTEATIAAVALQSLNTSHSPTLTASSSVCANLETQPHSTQIKQQQYLIVPATIEVTAEQQQPTQQQSQSSDSMITSTPGTPLSSSAQQSQQHQQHKSPQKNNSQHSNTYSGRKTPGKHGRTTSFSEDTEHHHHNEDNSTPKEKPKLSREDRKMEAILKAIEKMERNQQRKQEQKQAKRQNAGSHNTTPTSPNKTLDSGETAAVSKRSNGHAGTAGRSKKKRRAGAKGGQGSGHNNQRKRRRSRMNSQESVDESNQTEHDAITSESDGCAVMHSPPIQTIGSQRQPNFSTSTSASVAGGITTTATTLLPTETTNNVDQAAGLLMAFANPNISPVSNSSSVAIAEQIMQQSPHRSSSQYMISSNEPAASSPATPPSQVSSACLLIEAAVGPLESNLDSNNADIQNSEFKYPLQAKTKKHLMNNWLHQVEDDSADSDMTIPLPEKTSQSLQTPVTSVVCSDVAGESVVSAGLDSLLQAAMSDLNHSQTDAEEPQNLSIVAQKVEEFIQQSEASASGSQIQPQNNHSYDYEHNQQLHTTYATLPTPAVDLTLKTPLTIGKDLSSEMFSNNRNFNLPLQVSTCSNNSSVKKRWLRQAISEETHEDFQHTFSTTPSPITGIVNNTFSSSQLQSTATSSPISNYVPNGFTTPLKKRRLLLTGKDEIEENLSQNCGDLCGNSGTSPPLQQQYQTQIQFNMFQQDQLMKQGFENNKQFENDTHEDVDVDVEKCEVNDTVNHQAQEMTYKYQLQQDRKYSKIETDQNHDISVMASIEEDGSVLQTKSIISPENEVPYTEVKEENLEASGKQREQSSLADFNDQEDDVDILRSPSPGREMIKAEDNLVKIEPEDTSGTDDVKIDVEREESMAGDDDVVTQHKERKKELIHKYLKDDEHHIDQLFSENVEIKNIFEMATAKEDDSKQNRNVDKDVEGIKFKAEGHKYSKIKIENESHTVIDQHELKGLNLEKFEVGERKLVSIIKTAKDESLSVNEIHIKPDICKKSKASKKREIDSQPSTKESEKLLKTGSNLKEIQPLYSDIAEVTSASSAVLESKSSAETMVASVGASTPPLPLVSTIVGGVAAPIQRQKSLSDDDIQARLHKFHKENILFLQSRNKKTKSSSSLTSNANSNSLVTNNSDIHKNKISCSSSLLYNQHHQSHNQHHHESKEKSDKYNLKHHKTSSATSSGTSKKQKLHKRERTTSSSSSNSHKSSTNQQITPPSSLLNKTAVVNSTSSGSSKKLKSLKKSSSGSSTSSNTSLSSYSSSSTLAFQTCCPLISSATTTTNNSEKEKVVDMDKHHRQRTTSTSNSNINASSSNIHVTSTASHSSSKKRQLNFELELTKDMHLLNSVATGGSKHKRDTSRLLPDEQNHIPTKKSRKDSHLSQKEELKNATHKLVKIEKQQDKKKSILTAGSTSTNQSVEFNTYIKSQPLIIPVTNMTNLQTPKSTPTEEAKLVLTVVPQQADPHLTPTPILKEHPTLPHFNNATNSSLTNHQQPLTPVQSLPSPTAAPQNIPSQLNSPSFVPSVYSTQHPQLPQPSLPPTPPPPGGVTSPLSTPNVNSATHLPFYNTIYGKLLDNTTSPPILPTPLPLSNTTTPSPPITSASVPTGGSVLSEYLDTKLKSYNTLGGYVSNTALFGLSNTVAIKDPPVSPAVVSSSTILVGSVTAHARDPATDMAAPPPPPSTTSSNNTTTITPLKIHTKTASHDPRLNPQLTAPEPPPQPKRKLSINEYRKRMQQSSSNDSNSGSLTTTCSTTSTSLDPAFSPSLLGPLTNKCTLNSPDRLTQSVDSQIQKEIMSTTAVTSSSSLDSLHNSNSSTSLSDTLLKSSSFVEEDSTKGQFNAAPTLLEKQQENLCARLKSLKEKQSLTTSFSVGSGTRSRFSSFSESVASGDFGFRKGEDDMHIIRNRNVSISSSIGGGDLLDNCLEEISSTSTSMSSSREPTPERCYTTQHKIFAASATTTVTNAIAASHSNNGQTTKYQQHNTNCDKSEMIALERKKSVDIA